MNSIDLEKKNWSERDEIFREFCLKAANEWAEILTTNNVGPIQTSIFFSTFINILSSVYDNRIRKLEVESKTQ